MGGGGWGPPPGAGAGGNNPNNARNQNIWGVPSPGYMLRYHVRSLDSAFQSGGLPPMDMGGLLGMGVSEAIKLQASQANTRAMFRDSIGDFEKFKSTVDGMRDSLNKLGYTRSNFLDFMKNIGQATGQVGESLRLSTKDLMTFSRAFNVDLNSMVGLGSTISRSTGMTTEAAAGKILGSGVSAAMFDETAQAEAQFAAQRMQLGVGGRAGARTYDAMLGYAESMRATNPVYQGAGGTRVAQQVYGMFASGGSLAAIFNPMMPGESYVDWRARLEKPTPEMLRRTMEGTRRMGQGGEIVLQQSTGMGFSDVVNQRGADFSRITSPRQIVTPTDKQAIEGTGSGREIPARASDAAAVAFGNSMLNLYGGFVTHATMFDPKASQLQQVSDAIATAIGSLLPGGLTGQMLLTAGAGALADKLPGTADSRTKALSGAAKAMGNSGVTRASGQPWDAHVPEFNLQERTLISYLVANGINIKPTSGRRSLKEELGLPGGVAGSKHVDHDGEPATAIDAKTLTPAQLARAKRILEAVGYDVFNTTEGTGMHAHIQPKKGTDANEAFAKLVVALEHNTAALKNPSNPQVQRARGR